MKSSKSRAAGLSLGGAVVASACSLLAPTDDELHAGAGGEGAGAAGEPSGGTAGTGGASTIAGQGGSGGGGNAGNGAGTASGGASGAGGSFAGGGSGGRSGSGGEGTGSGGESCLHELLVNGYFDDGPNGWTEESSDETPLIFHRASTLLIDQDVDAHSPDYLAWLGGSDDRTARVWRSIELPDGAMTVRVAGFYRINTDESYPDVFDEAYVELVQGTTAYALGYFTNLGEVSQWTAFENDIDADVFSGGPFTFQLRSQVDGSVDTAFFFDSISLTAKLASCE